MQDQQSQQKDLGAVQRYTTQGADLQREFAGPGHDEHMHGQAQHRVMDRSQIPGWGSDLDRENRPAVPMERTPPRLENVHWEQPEQQPLNIKVFHSPERPGITPIFGTSTPPRGLSGKIREAAYKLTENDVRHWMMLLLADRVDMVEGIGDDLMRGHIPNVLGEMGITAELKYNKAGFVRKVAVAAAVAGIGYYLLKRRSPDLIER
ncbi:MAG TPA: hypothetical protein VFT37_06025 [Telluria sp.]|nr:hypothetical protein [Telluria sp.]